MSLDQIALAIAGLAITVTLYCVSVARESAKTAREGEHRLSVLETKIGLFWHVIEAGAPNLLHRDDTPETDALLEKAAKQMLQKPEINDLIEQLKAIECDASRPKGDMTAALLMRAALIASNYEPE